MKKLTGLKIFPIIILKERSKNHSSPDDTSKKEECGEKFLFNLSGPLLNQWTKFF
jgi:hypothetical protein